MEVFEMVAGGMPLDVSVGTSRTGQTVACAMLPHDGMGVQVNVASDAKRDGIAQLIEAEVDHYRPSLESEYQTACPAYCTE